MSAAELFSVAGRVAVVTGGAQGLGFAMARAMADNGARVTIMDRDDAASAVAVAELVARGGTVRSMAVDLQQPMAVRQAFDAVAQRDGGLDIVFANAGITAGPGFLTPEGQRDAAGSVENIPDALWDTVIGVNLTGVFLTIQAAVPHLKARGRGRIIVTSSTAALKTSPTVGTPYLVTKAAVAHLVRQVAVELARDNILVNAIAPGPFLTRITTPGLKAAFERGSPMHRAADTDEIEGLALFFASDASSFVTGAHYVLDGGMTLGRAD